jgi:hypothetical protein
MTEYVLQITEEQQKKLLQLLDMVQVRLSEAKELMDLRDRVQNAQEKKIE